MIWSLWAPLGLFIVGFGLAGSNVAPTFGAFMVVFGFAWLVGSGLRAGWRAAFRRRRVAKHGVSTEELAPAVRGQEAPIAARPVTARTAAPVARRRSEAPPVSTIPEWVDDNSRTPVVGESNYQAALRQLFPDPSPDKKYLKVSAILQPENGNKFDAMAIAVRIDGQLVGYLSRDDARRFRQRLRARDIVGRETACKALILGGYVGRDGKQLGYGVALLFNLDRPKLV